MDQNYTNTPEDKKKSSKFKPKSTIAALILIAFGLILVIMPGSAINTICMIVSLVALVIGIVYLTSFVVKKKHSEFSSRDISTAIGAFIIALIVFILMKTTLIITIIPFILGIIVLISGIIKLHTAIEIKHMNNNSMSPLIIAIINVVLGVVLIIFPFSFGIAMCIAMGIALIFCGVTGLISNIKLGKSADKFYNGGNNANSDAIDVDFRDVPPQQ